MLEIYTFGGVDIQVDGIPVGNLHSKKALGLLIFLALSPKPVKRQYIAALFWGTSSQDQANNNLRVLLCGIRKQLRQYVTIDRETVGLVSSSEIWIDAINLNSFIVANQIRSALSIYQGEFMRGFFLRNCIEFENWMTIIQEQFHEELLEAIYSGILSSIEVGNNSEAIYLAREYIKLCPISESVYFQLMTALVLSGRREAAIFEYQKCTDILKEELGILPDNHLTMLFQQIANGDFAQKD